MSITPEMSITPKCLILQIKKPGYAFAAQPEIFFESGVV